MLQEHKMESIQSSCHFKKDIGNCVAVALSVAAVENQKKVLGEKLFLNLGIYLCPERQLVDSPDC